MHRLTSLFFFVLDVVFIEKMFLIVWTTWPPNLNLIGCLVQILQRKPQRNCKNSHRVFSVFDCYHQENGGDLQKLRCWTNSRKTLIFWLSGYWSNKSYFKKPRRVSVKIRKSSNQLWFQNFSLTVYNVQKNNSLFFLFLTIRLSIRLQSGYNYYFQNQPQ